ncbi:MAG: hypothetical protein A2452_08925 [Candidatus Firestonebacteria bacterium RIFOXYC2_FULL_39_67]|nr:MAG: hypothetical protein A2536_09575 [Candidatus Firestonebacteria bacterium RIFOXYD2_FULL_39_29]OGF53574.1 MAG: hypothetical protein A2452_08925 [Candidatus Firestonebacteria bacterium RIFOXYC2_FULL_39_67]
MYTVYVLLSKKDGKTYTGCTNNIERRISDHNNGKEIATKGRKPFIMIYSETYPDLSSARKREIYLKTGKGKEFIKENPTSPI